MNVELREGVFLFVDDDMAFVDWCHAHPNGYFYNCRRNRKGEATAVLMLHSTYYRDKVCQHFRNSNAAGGFQPNLTTRGYCKVASDDLKLLRRWAMSAGGQLLGDCSSCARGRG